MRSMTDFIMEQEIAENSVDTGVSVIEGFMKLNAVGAIAECYCEHAAIAEFSTNAGLSIFSESDDNVFTKAWNSVTKFFENIIEWLKAMVRAVIQMITRTKLEKLITRLKMYKERGTDDAGHKFDIDTQSGIPKAAVDVTNILALIDEFKTALANVYGGATPTGIGAVETVSKKAKDFVEKFKDVKKNEGGPTSWEEDDGSGTPKTVTSGTWRDILGVLENAQQHNAAKNAHSLLKSLNFKAKDFHAENKKTESSDVKKVKEAAKWLAKAYDKYTAYTIKLVSKVLNEQVKKEELEDLQKETSTLRKTNENGQDYKMRESYYDNTDGYYFL